MNPDEPKLRRLASWLNIALSISISIAYALCILTTTVPLEQQNDSDSTQAVEEARAILAGCHNAGLVEYSHHPIGRAYILLPFVDRLQELQWVPITIGAVSTAAALLACLLLSSTPTIKAFSLATFSALLFQDGFSKWLGHLHQHSYNMSSVMILIALCISFRNISWMLGIMGCLCGWIGYDFIFLQVFTIITMRFVFWRARHGMSLWPALRESIGESSIFALFFSIDVALKLIQNTMYFNSATSALHDFYSSLEHRSALSGMTAFLHGHHGRAWSVYELLKLYTTTFWSSPKWSSPPFIVGAAALGTVGALLWYLSPQRRGAHREVLSQSVTFCVASLLSVCALVAWFAAAPTHAAAHGQLFARAILIPLLLTAVSLIVCLRPAETHATPPTSHLWRRRMIQAGFSLTTLWFLPLTNIGGLIDKTSSHSVWHPVTAGFRDDAFDGAHLHGEPSASSTHPSASIREPIALKNDRLLVGTIGMWGQSVDGEGKSWWPDSSGPLPPWYQLTFDKPQLVSDIALRLYGRARQCGAHTPRGFSVQLVDDRGKVSATVTYPGSDFTTVEQGKFLNFNRHFAPPVPSRTLRITFDGTQQHEQPVLLDLHAFGAPDE